MRHPDKELISNAATALVSSLRNLGHTSALCGDFACYTFGSSHIPERVEAVIFASSEPSIQDLRSQVVQNSEGHFVSKDKADTLLYCTTEGTSKKTFPADISYLDTQAVHLIQYVHGLPFVPITYIILRKLEEWADPPGRLSKRSRKRAANVIQELLRSVHTMHNVDTESLYPPLWDASSQYIFRFKASYSGHSPAWKKLGFGSALKSSPQMQSSKPLTLTRSLEILPELPEFELPRIADPTHIQMAIMAANDSFRLLYKCGWHSAIFGGLACFLYGNNRVPNDVDLLVLPPSGITVSAEDLKKNLVAMDPYHFFTTPCQESQTTYHILWYRLSDGSVQTTKNACKVDLLLPGAMNLPNLPPSMIHWDEALPLVPFSLLLLQKLQAWDDHRRSKDPLQWQRQRTDMEDLDGLTSLSASAPLKYSRSWSDTTLFSPEFQKLTKERVFDFCTSFPQFAATWISLGFKL